MTLFAVLHYGFILTIYSNYLPSCIVSVISRKSRFLQPDCIQLSFAMHDVHTVLLHFCFVANLLLYCTVNKDFQSKFGCWFSSVIAM